MCVVLPFARFYFRFLCVGVFFLLAFHFVGVVASSLTMRTLCHLGVGVESHALAKKNKKKTKKTKKLKKLKQNFSFSCFWGGFVLFWSPLISFTLAISLYTSVSAG